MNKIIVWQTDFTMDWPFVSTMKGVCKQIDPEIECIDSCHTIEKFNILEASQQLNYIVPFWSDHTIFVSVVDPGVGTSRKASAAKLKNSSIIITPDNGTLTHVYYNIGIEEIREIDPSIRYKGTEDVSVFHGRDIFAYSAAMLASDKLKYEELGALYDVKDIVLLDYSYLKADVSNPEIEGMVTNVSDPFGSIVFNILTSDFKKYYHFGDMISITLTNEEGIYFEDKVPYGKAFGDVDIGSPIIFNSSSDYISIGINQGSFKEKYKVKTGSSWKVKIKG